MCLYFGALILLWRMPQTLLFPSKKAVLDFVDMSKFSLLTYMQPTSECKCIET